MAIGGVAAPAGAAVNASPYTSNAPSDEDVANFKAQLAKNAVLTGIGNMDSMEEKHNNSLKEQRESDNGPG
jgi:hypothetical protein